jgi:putative RecB family exonuclease
VSGAAVTRLSAAALNRFRVCPKQFRLVDLERSPRRDGLSPQLAAANAVHHALERFFGLPVEQRAPELLERALRSVWPAHRKPGTFASRDEEAAWGRAALEMLETFACRFELSVTPLAREQWLSVRLENRIELFGKVDRIDESPAGALEIVDYKTGRRPLDADDLRREPAAQVYVALAEAAYSRPVERVRFIYVALGLDVAWEPEREDVDAVKSELLQLTEEIRTATEFPAVPGTHCRFCPAALHCDERQRVELRDLKPVEALPF